MGKIWDLRNKKGKFKKFRSIEYPKGLSKDNKNGELNTKNTYLP
jgi:hypothetical protein